MRTPPLLFTTLFLAISGCVPAQHADQVSADQWVDDQIALSATSLSLAQQRLHATSAATEATSLVRSVPLPTPTAPMPVAVVSKPVQPSAGLVVAPPKSFPATPAPQPTIINVVAAPAVPAIVPPAASVKTGGTSSTPPVVGTPPVPMSALITKPAPAVPVVKPAPPPMPVWEARAGERLEEVIQRWSDKAGYTVDWRAEGLDYPIDAPLRFQGSYEEAVFSIFKLYEKAERSFVVDGRRRQHRLIINEDQNSIRRAMK